jgi:MFS family permease
MQRSHGAVHSLIVFFRRLTMVPQGITIVAAGFLPVFAIVSMFPAIPAIIDHFAGDPDARWKVPMMVSAPGLTIALIAPFAGFFVDRFGRRTLLIGATLLYGIVGTAPFFLASLNALIICRLLLGVAEAAILTSVNTLIADYWDDRGRQDWLFLQGVCGPFLASGVILLSGAASSIRWNSIFLVYAIAFPIFVAMIAWLREPRRADGATIADISQGEKAPRTPFPAASVALIGIVTLIASALYYVFIISGSLAWREVGVMDPARISQLTAIPSLFVMLGALLFRLMGNMSHQIKLATFFALIGVGLTGIGLAPDWRWLTAALIVQQTGAGMAVATIILWAQSMLPFEHRGRGMGIWTACFFFGQFSSPWLVHQAENLVGTMQGAFLATGLVGVIAALIIGLARSSRAPAPTIAVAE